MEGVPRLAKKTKKKEEDSKEEARASDASPSAPDPQHTKIKELVMCKGDDIINHKEKTDKNKSESENLPSESVGKIILKKAK